MIEQLILDIKGVLYNDSHEGKKPTEGSIGFIRYLYGNKIPFMLATNITSEMPQDIVVGLNRLGFGVSLENVASAIDISIQYLKRQGIKRVFLISDNEQLREFYKQHGIEVIGYDDIRKSDAVVAALDRRLYSDRELTERVMAAARYEILRGSRLIALHRNLERKDEDDQTKPNVGKLVMDLEQATGCRDTVNIGKPSETFYREVLKKLPSQNPLVTLAVGDDPIGDLSGAHYLEMPVALVRSGKYQGWPAELKFRPDFEVDNVAELIQFLQRKR